MERLTTEDLVLLWPDEVWPQDIGALAVLAGGKLLDPDGGFRIEAARDHVASRLHLVPRFRQLLHLPRRGLGPPLWVDAPAVDLTYHVRLVPIPPPGSEAQLLLAVERLRQRRLDRSRPLWEMCFLPGLPDGRVGLFVRIHHVVADGIAAVATIGTLLDATPDASAAAAPPWTPAPVPRARELFTDNVRRHIDALGGAISTLTHPAATARQARAARLVMREFPAGVPTPATSLDHRVGPSRNVVLIRSDLDQVTEIAHRHGAKVNDVLLALTAAGVRGLLRSRGESVDDLILPVYVPVTLRQPEARAQARGNLIGQMVVPLPIGPADPGRRLRQIAAETARQKAGSHPSLGTVLRGPIARRAMLKLLERHPVSVTTADVPGPPAPVYLAGAGLLEIFPLLPLIANVSLGVGALSYANQFNMAAVADRDACPDLGPFTTSVEEEWRALAASVSPVDPGSAQVGRRGSFVLPFADDRP